MANNAASDMLDKLGRFMATLDDDERAALAALLAPGIAAAHRHEPEVEGFGVARAASASDEVEWSPWDLPEHLAEQVRAQHFRIEHDPE